MAITSVTKYYETLGNTHNSYTMVRDGITSQVPLDPANLDYQAIQDWIAAGNSVVDPNAE